VRVRLAIRIGFAIAAVIVAAGLVIAARGSRERVRLATADAGIRKICLSREPRPDRELLDRCFSVRGTLLHVWREYDAAGRLDDVHLLVTARFHLYVVKVYPPFPAHVRIGHEVVAVGPLVRPHPEHLGIHEVEGFSVHGAGL
jgi:hypothetical protein